MVIVEGAGVLEIAAVEVPGTGDVDKGIDLEVVAVGVSVPSSGTSLRLRDTLLIVVNV